jgi:hypothetical protein
VIANGNSGEVLERLRALAPETVRVEALTLEEVFVSTLQPAAVAP